MLIPAQSVQQHARPLRSDTLMACTYGRQGQAQAPHGENDRSPREALSSRPDLPNE